MALEVVLILFFTEEDLLAVTVDNYHLVICRFTALGKGVRDAAAGGLRKSRERVKGNAGQAVLRAGLGAGEGAGALEADSGKIVPCDLDIFPECVRDSDSRFGDFGAGFYDPPQSEDGDNEQSCEVFGGPSDAQQSNGGQDEDAQDVVAGWLENLCLGGGLTRLVVLRWWSHSVQA